MSSPAEITWNSEAAAHLLRRAGFGGTPEDAEVLAAAGLEGAVDRLLADDGRGLPSPPVTDPAEFAHRRQLRLARRRENEGAQNEGAAMDSKKTFERAMRETLAAMRAWWLECMRRGGAGAREKLTLFWHGHFATSQAKVQFNHIMLAQNETLRRLGAGPFRELCAAMVRDPAMLVWLDGRQSQGKAPNENFAREILELFTLGEGHYTEEDIREAARCFTGWVVNPENGDGMLVPRRYDDGRKKLFGKSGNFGAADAVEIICAQPRCAEFLATKLWEFYAYPQPEPELVKSLAAHYRKNDLHTGELLRMIFTRPEFYSPRAVAKQIKSPVQWMVQAARETGRQLLPPGVALPLSAELGQNLFMPPSVKGWDGGTAWINSATLIRRSNTALLFAVAAPPLPVDAESMDAAAWAVVAPPETRFDAVTLAERLEKVFLAAPAGPATRKRLEAVLEEGDFPCSDDTVREASVVLLGSPEYNIC
ncbi:MAG: DUF1800 family protein [Chthoniobacterales bacterium]